MTDSGNICPPPVEIQDFLFKQASVEQICDQFPSSPISYNLIAVDAKRGLTYIGHENKLIVLKPGNDTNPEWKFEVDMPDRVSRVALSCDYSFLSVTCSNPSALIYDASSIHKHKLDLLHEIRLSTSNGEVYVTDLKWNPAIPDILCTITSDHTIGCFQVTKDKKTGVQIIGMEKAQGLEALCVSWSPKGKQIVIGCKNGDIIQLKPELKLARHLTGPNPSEGIIISILWISNYQFCACYFQYEEQRINLMIVDAPKGVTIPKFTNYEDITFGSGPMDYLCYYLEHVPEWGIIIAACSNSSEVCVLGTLDNGTNWSVWQLNEGFTVQLPLNRKTKTENFPVGIAVDKSSVQKLPWGPDSMLPNPVPVLRILATSGQLCCYHMVNLRENVPTLCSPPSELIAAPQLRRPNAPASDVSFNFAGATSTPRAKPVAIENVPVSAALPAEKPKSSANIFGNPANSNFSFLAPTNKTSADVPQAVLPQTEVKTSGFFNPNDGKSGFFQQDNKTTKPVQTPQVDLQFNQPPANLQQPNLSSGLSVKPDNRAEIKIPVVTPQVQTESNFVKEPVKEPPQYSEEVKSKAKEAPVYDEGLCLQAYYEEQNKFEKELKNQLELPSWECGTEEERILIVKKTEEINEFLQELRETTDSLSSDVTYLKALLLQSFAWLEESKSKNSVDPRSSVKYREDTDKLAETQRRYYYVQSQLKEASKKLDLRWSEQNNREVSRMKIPSLEVIYQSLIRYNQIIIQEKKQMDDMSKKWRSLGRPAPNSNSSNNVTSLDRSMASLNLSHNASLAMNDSVIDMRCQNIARSTKNFSREKQMKLRDLLSESAPRIIRVARPSAIQDRMEATLQSLASSKLQQQAKTKSSKVGADQMKSSPKPKTQNPLSSLDNLVSGIPNSASSFGKSPSSVAPFSTFSSETAQPKSKENITLSFGQQPSAAYSVSKPKETINFGGSPQKTGTEFQFTAKSTSETPKFSFNPEISITVTTKTSGFSFSTPPNFTVPKVDSFKFSTKASPPQAQTPAQGGLDLSNLSFGAKTAPGTPPAFSFGKSISPQQQLTTPSTPPSSSSNTSAVSVTLFGKSSPEKTASVPATTASMFGSSSMFGGLSTSAGPGTTFKFNPTSAQTGATTTTSPTTTTSTASSFGSFSATTTTTSMPSFGGLLNATASLSFGSDGSTTITPAFGKTTSIFGTTTPPTAPTSASASPIFGGKSSINAKPSSPASSSSTSTVSSSNSETKAASTTSVFGNVSSTTTAEQAPAAAVVSSSSSDTNIFTTKPPATTSSSMFGGSTATTTSAPLFGSSSGPVFGGTSATTQSSNVFGASGTSVFGTSTAGNSVFGGTSALFSTLSTTATTTATTSVFGSAAATSGGGSLFGGNTATTATSPFASTTSPTTTASVFGSTTSPATTASVFGSTTSPTTTASIFGSSATPTTTASIFGAGAPTTSASIFGSAAAKPASVFGGTAATTTASVFGSPPATTTSASVFGGATATTTTASLFGGVSSTNAFGGSSLFGSSGAPSGSLFGSSATATTASSTFGSPVSPATTAASPFGAQATTSPNMFGAPAAGTTFGAVTPQKTGNVFGAPAGGSMFGGSAVLGSGNPMFGAAASPTSAFGQPSGFGQAPSFSTSPGSGFSAFGSPAAFGSAASPTGFGSPTMLGSTSPPAMGNTSPSNAFNSTFEALGAQSGGLSFGSLAQKTPEPKPQAFQGSSSFSSWR